MISTITTSTISTVTLAGSFALFGVLVLLALLLQKEFTSGTDSARSKKFGKALNIGIFPLLIVFIMVIAAKVFDVLN